MITTQTHWRLLRYLNSNLSLKYRRAEVASTNTFGTTKTNNLNYVSFSAKRYGKSSYIITPTVTLEPGEYGITVSNPNAVDEKQTVVSAFAVEK